MAADSRVPVALIGGGTIAPLHAKYLMLSPNCRLVALIDPFEPGKILASSLSVPHFESVAALLASPVDNPDGYIICVPSSLHVKVATEVIISASPKAILIEKPIATESQPAMELLELAREKSCQILVGHHRRSHPSIVASRKAIEGGKIGKIICVSCLWVTKKDSGYFDLAAWRSSRSAGGGPVWTNLIHDIDMVHYLTGSRITQVWSIPSTRLREHLETRSSDLVEEGAAVMAQFEDGVVGTFLLSDNSVSPFNWESAAGDNPSYPKASRPVDCYRVFGSKGTLSGPDGTVWSYSPGQAEQLGLEEGWNIPISCELVEAREGIPFQNQTEHFSKVIQGLEEPICSGKDGVAAVKVCEAVIQALDRNDGMPVAI
ncbi:hypothetical protein N7474_002560 [Penicillium riverlandense]|uniref:uncharacterized protein n=1 Tax=Penicillium riverlandense TaxID=1903569 RepID=UPI002548D377|nr:uncharacterized protein N7474_002560 [Penicillium riverlandense]KAJ5825422.1 hypothetical protein N7474_002560 [Penicillium riverlandense]